MKVFLVVFREDEITNVEAICADRRIALKAVTKSLLDHFFPPNKTEMNDPNVWVCGDAQISIDEWEVVQE